MACAYRICKFVHSSCYWWRYFQLGCRNKQIFFIPCTQDKTIKENQYETNSKENPVWNKWQLQLLIMCSHMGSNIKKNVTHNKYHGWHSMHRVSKTKTITIYLKFDTTLLEINLTFVLGYLSSILGELVNYFHKLYGVILIIRRVHM